MSSPCLKILLKKINPFNRLMYTREMSKILNRIEDKLFHVLMFCIIISYLVYLPIIFGQPFWDDWTFLFNRERYQFDGKIWDFFPGGLYPKAWPVFYSVFWLLLKIFKEHFFLYHILSIFIHAANSTLIYSILKKFNLKQALIIALIYLVHPTHLFTIAWIIQLKTLLSIFFFLLSIQAILKYISHDKLLYSIISLAFFILSVLSKSTTASLSACLVLFSPYFIKAKLINKKSVYFFIIITFFISSTSLYLTAKNYNLNTNKASSNDEKIVKESSEKYLPQLNERILISLKNTARYTVHAVLPLSPPYLYQKTTTLENSREDFIYIFCFVAITLYILGYLLKEKKYFILFSLSFYFFSLIPFTGLVYIPIFFLYNFVPHWLSIPIIGLLPMIQIIEDKTRVLIFFLGFFAITTHIYSYNFYNTERIFIKSIEASDNNINYSAALVEHYIVTKECQKAESA
jgi:hypothetical protein